MLLADSEEELDRMARYFNDVCGRRMLKVSVSKTLLFERDRISQCAISLHVEELDAVGFLRYLGVNFGKELG